MHLAPSSYFSAGSKNGAVDDTRRPTESDQRGVFFLPEARKLSEKLEKVSLVMTSKKRLGDVSYCLYTIPKTNIAPKNGWLEDELIPFWDGLFSGAMLVSGRVIKCCMVVQ